ncbi:MAG: tetratricopeptide repeat protein [Clostridia bacterium]|nr:tetratricopeptide repeat protein [Clostridia bacterium]
MDERKNLDQVSPQMLEALDLTEKAHMLIVNDEFEEAEKLLEKAEKTEPMCSRIYLEKGGLKVLRADYAGALEEYRRTLMIDENDPEAHYMMGNTHLLLDEFKTAELEYAAADRAGYEDMHLLNNMGFCQERQGKYDAALRSYQRTIEKYPEWDVPYIRRIGCLMVMRKIEQAEEEAKAAKDRFPDIPAAWKEYARTLSSQYKYEQAENLLREAVQRFPENIDLKLHLMDVCIIMGKEAEAQKLSAEIRAIEGIPPEVLTHLDKVEADAYLRTEQIDKAIECYRACVARDTPENPDVEARQVLMTIYRTTGRYKELQQLAADSTRTVKGEDELCSAHVMEAIAVDEMGRKEEAAALYREAIRKMTMIAVKQRSRVDTHVYRAMCHIGLGETDKAMEEVDYVEKVSGENLGTKELRAQILRKEGKTAEAEALEQELKKGFEAMRTGGNNG